MKTDEFLKSKWLMEHHCPICGKEFYPTREWVYKTGGTYYCSWSCHRKAPEPVEVLMGAPVRKLVEQYSLEGEYLQTYRGLGEAADAIYASEWGIKAAIKKGKPYKGYLWRYKENDMPKV